MTVIKIIISSAASIVIIFLLTKLIGNRQLSEASMFDYINGITIGSIAAEMATSLEKDIIKPIVAMVVYALIVMLISFLCRKSLTLRRFFSGRSIILMDNDKIYFDNFKKAGLDINEFLVQCRLNGFFDIEDIQSAIFETNGKVSILPKEQSRPVQLSDANIFKKQKNYMTNLIIDGKIIRDNLVRTGRSEEWLNNQIKAQNIKSINDILLATYDGESNVNFYIKNNEKNSQSPFE